MSDFWLTLILKNVNWSFNSFMCLRFVKVNSKTNSSILTKTEKYWYIFLCSNSLGFSFQSYKHYGYV